MNTFLTLNGNELVQPLRDLAGKGFPFATLAIDAVEGLTSVVAAATLPVMLTYQRIYHLRFDRFQAIEAIQTSPEPDAKDDYNDIIFERSKEVMEDFLATQKGKDFIRESMLKELDPVNLERDILTASQQLIFQGLVSTWSVFEVFSSDFLIASVNMQPSLAKKILASENLRKYLGKPLLDVDAIDSIGYDLTNSMGDLIFKNRRLDNLTFIRDLLELILDSTKVSESLRSQHIWMLNQRRNLIVHRRGIVDQEYLSRTSDEMEIGSKLHVTAIELELYLSKVRDAIHAILSEQAGA